jgi:rubrerythrin
MQRMERFAVQVYRKQIRAFRRLEIADKLKDAAANEQEHADALTKEKHAVSDYGNFLQKVDFDEKSVALINRIVVDEEKHIETWNNSLKILKSSK